MKKFNLILQVSTVVLFVACNKGETPKLEKLYSGSGTVTSVCTGCTANGEDYTPYIITMDKNSDSILVTTKAGVLSLSEHVTFTYKNGDTVKMIQTTDRFYPRRVTLISLTK